MERVSGVLVASILFLSAGCASLPDTGGKASFPSMNTRIAELDLALKQETDGKKVPALLFERGHAYLDSAESLRASRRAAGEIHGGGVEFATLILHALRDLEAVVDEFPDSTEAPEALFHLGAVYDYPNISSFGPALRYYRRTVAEYPGTVPAIRAEQAIRIIEVNVKQVMDGEHGGGG